MAGSVLDDRNRWEKKTGHLSSSTSKSQGHVHGCGEKSRTIKLNCDFDPRQEKTPHGKEPCGKQVKSPSIQ